ncbi:MAG: helix-turn-helix domain-containing protein [Roseibium sp.]
MTCTMKKPRLSIIPAEAITDPKVSAMALKVLAAFGRHTDRAGFCFRSLRKLAGELDMARSTVQRAIASLIQAGWLVRFRSRRKDGGDCSSGFRVLLRKAEEDIGDTADRFEPPQKPVYREPEATATAQPGGPPADSPHKNGPTKTKTGVEPDKGVGAEGAFVQEVKTRLQAIGWTVTPAWFRQGDAPLKAWFWGGCDIDRDVMPTILDVLLKGKTRPASLAYFTKAVFRARNARREIENLSPDSPPFRSSQAAKLRAEKRAYHAAFDAVEAEILAEAPQ